MAKMYNGIRKVSQPKVIAIVTIEHQCWQHENHGHQYQDYKRQWRCGFNQLEFNSPQYQDPEIATRVSLTKDLTVSEIPGVTNDEMIEMKNSIASYMAPHLCYFDFTNYVLICILPLIF